MLSVGGWHVRSVEDGLPEIKRIANVNIKDYTALSATADAADLALIYDSSASALRSCAMSNMLAGTASNVAVADAAGDTTTFVLLAGSATGASLPVLSDDGLTYDAATNTLTAGGFSGPLNGTVGATTPAAGTFTNLTVNGNTILGDASGDSLTINAGTWTIGNSFTATRAIGVAAAGSVTHHIWNTTFSGDAGGTSDVESYSHRATVSGANSLAAARLHRDTLTMSHSAGTISNAPLNRSSVIISGAGAVTNAHVLQSSISVTGAGNLTNAILHDAVAPTLSSTGAITTIAGFRASNLGHATLVTNAFGFDSIDMTAALTTTAAYRSQMTSGTGKWGFLASGSANNAFAGNVRIGSTTAPTVPLDVTGAALISSTLGVTGAISSATLTSGRVALVGTSGAIIDDAGITYDAAANSITATTFIGALSGNATTATTATTASNVVVADAAADTTTFVMLAGSATGSSLPVLTDAGLTYNASTNALTATTFVGALTGNADTSTTATNVTVANEATDTSCFLLFATDATGNLGAKSNANMTFNSNTGVVTLASSVLTTTDINGGTVDGAVIGGSSPAAGTFTTLTANGNTTLGDAAADTLTINAETISAPNIPCFLAFNSATDTNQTGNGAVATVDFDTEVFDQSADFSADTFTAPATGRYLFTCQVRVDDLTTAMNQFQLQLLTSNRAYNQIQRVHVEAAADLYIMHMSVIADMDAADTALVRFVITGGAGDTADIFGVATNPQTFFSGMRVA